MRDWNVELGVVLEHGVRIVADMAVKATTEELAYKAAEAMLWRNPDHYVQSDLGIEHVYPYSIREYEDDEDDEDDGCIAEALKERGDAV